MKIIDVYLALLCVAVCGQAAAHHSYAIYDIDNKIARTGVLTRFDFSYPHIELELMVENASGDTVEIWTIESTSPQRWARMGKSRRIAEPGEIVTIEGWPARDGHDEMLLSSIATERGREVIIDSVRQPGAREKVPGVTVKRD